ncbi:hypothetical protein ACFLVX_02535 [Chloroflexota bacterium]
MWKHGFVYVSQGSPIRVSGEVISSPVDLHVDFVELWLGAEEESVAGSLIFSTAQEAKAVSDLVSGAFRKYLVDRQLFLLHGPKDQSMEAAISSGDFVTAASKYATVWQGLKKLPEQPPHRPVAAGFLKLEEEQVDAIERRLRAANVNVPLSRLVSYAMLQQIVFGVYAKGKVDITPTITQQALEATRPSAVLIAKTSHPDFLINTFLGSASGRLEMEKVPLEPDLQAYRLEANGFHLLLSVHENHIYVSLGLSEREAGDLLISALTRKERAD